MGYENGGDVSVTFPRNEDGTIIADDSDYLATWKEMEKLVAAGLVRAIGVSNFSKSQIQLTQKIILCKPLHLYSS